MRMDTVYWRDPKYRSVDSVYCRNPKYYFTDYYDTVRWFLAPRECGLTNHNLNDPDVYMMSVGSQLQSNASSRVYAFPHNTDKPLVAKGIVFMVSYRPGDPEPESRHANRTIMNNDKLPEYVYLMYDDTTRFPRIQAVDSIRWDTLHPKVIELPRTIDSTFLPPMYAILYEASFNHPHVLEGEFWLGGSCFSNTLWHNITGNYEHFPTYYIGPACWRRGYLYYTTTRASDYSLGESAGYWSLFETYMFSPFGIINDLTELVATSSDSAFGTVEGGGYYHDSTSAALTAIPAATYRFTHWNDGDTNNPRTVLVTQDSLFTAYFEPAPRHTVVAVADDTTMGTVDGGGEYYEDEDVVLTAIPANDSVHFSRWNDSVNDNPRHVTLRSDTVFTAFFAHGMGIKETLAEARFILSPNPTTGKVAVATGGVEGVLTVYDAAGHEVQRMTVEKGRKTVELDLAALPRGTYFVTLATPTATSTQRLVLQ